jgi:hypothetical protein
MFIKIDEISWLIGKGARNHKNIVFHRLAVRVSYIQFQPAKAMNFNSLYRYLTLLN